MVCRYGSSAPPIQAFSVLVWTQLATLHYSQCFCHCWWNSHSLHSEGMPFALYILNNNNNNFFLKKSALLSFVWQAERMPKITQPALYLLPPQNIYLYNYNISMISPFGGIIIYNKLFHLSSLQFTTVSSRCPNPIFDLFIDCNNHLYFIYRSIHVCQWCWLLRGELQSPLLHCQHPAW